MKKILLIVGILVVLIIVGLGLTAKYYTPRMMEAFVKNDKAVLIEHVDKFLFNVQQGKASEAYALTDQKSIPIETLSNSEWQEDLKKYASQDSNFYRLKVSKFLSKRYVVEYLTTTYFTDGKEGQIQVIAKKEGDSNNWEIMGMQWATPPDKLW